MNPPWLNSWTQGPWPYDHESIKWIQSRPASIKRLMLLFPPSCVVTPIQILKIPAPNTLGIVTSYVEPQNPNEIGFVTVRQNPDSDLRAECKPNALKVVNYFKGLTPEVVAYILNPHW